MYDLLTIEGLEKLRSLGLSLICDGDSHSVYGVVEDEE
jgi:hypothetical protein